MLPGGKFLADLTWYWLNCGQDTVKGLSGINTASKSQCILLTLHVSINPFILELSVSGPGETTRSKSNPCPKRRTKNLRCSWYPDSYNHTHTYTESHSKQSFRHALLIQTLENNYICQSCLEIIKGTKAVFGKADPFLYQLTKAHYKYSSVKKVYL